VNRVSRVKVPRGCQGTEPHSCLERPYQPPMAQYILEAIARCLAPLIKPATYNLLLPLLSFHFAGLGVGDW